MMPSEKPPRPAVIGDVAALAGVSIPTVSRVLTGVARVSAGKEERVLAAIKTLNFRPSPAARALVSRRPTTIGIVTGNTSRFGYAETIRGIEEAARVDSLTVSIVVTESTEVDEIQRATELLLQQPLAGVIVLKFDAAGVAMLQSIPRDLAVVAVSGVRDRSVAQAVLDESAAGQALTNYLLGLGHASVHHVRVPPSRREDGRTSGWRRALVAAGVEPPEVWNADWTPASGRAIGREIGVRGDITAVFCGNDEIAMGVIRGLADAGKRVPDDVSVVGFDDHPLAELWTPALTTARQDFAGLGQRSYALLKIMTAGGVETPPFSSKKPTLVVRESAAAPPA